MRIALELWLRPAAAGVFEDGTVEKPVQRQPPRRGGLSAVLLLGLAAALDKYEDAPHDEEERTPIGWRPRGDSAIRSHCETPVPQ